MNGQDSFSNKSNYGTQQLPYNPERFRTFVQIILRLFHDSPAIVVGDFLIREQKSFTDRDIANKLKLNDRQVRESLRQLEGDFIVVKDQKNDTSNLQNNPTVESTNKLTSSRSEKNIISEPKLPLNNKINHPYYRINPYLPAVIEWQLNTITRKFEQNIKDADSLDELSCKICNSKYTSLDALSLNLDPTDGLFLCRFCNFKLVSVDSAAFKNAAKDKAERAKTQLKVLVNSLELVKNMNIPVFPQYKKLKKQKNSKSDDNPNNNDTNSPLNSDIATRNLNNQNTVVSNSQGTTACPYKKTSATTTNIIDSHNMNTNINVYAASTKVKFGIKLPKTLVENTNIAARKSGIDANKNNSMNVNSDNINHVGNHDQVPNNNSDAINPKNNVQIEPTFSISAIKDKIFKISEINDDIINLMTDSEYLEYDELLQKHHTSGLFN